MGILIFLFRELLANLGRSRLMTMSAISTVCILQLILGTFGLFWSNLNYWTTTFTQQMQVVVFLKEDVQPEGLTEKIASIGHVSQVRFIDKDIAFKDLQKELHGAVQIQDLGANPLHDRFNVQVDQARFLGDVANKLKVLPGVDKVKYGGDIAKALNNLNKSVSWAGTVVCCLLVLATMAVVGNTIRLTVFARRREIEIMQMVGAARWFIQIPFVGEGIFQGVTGTLIAVAVLAPAYVNIVAWMSETMPFLPCLQADSLATWLWPGMLGLGVLIGAFGSTMSVNRYLKI